MKRHFPIVCVVTADIIAAVSGPKLLYKPVPNSPVGAVGQGLQAAGAADQAIQGGHDLAELGPLAAVLLPAVQH